MDLLDWVDPHGMIAFLIEVALKGTIVLAIAGLATALLKSASAAVRNLVWSTSIVFLLALPAFVALAPSYDLAVLPPETESVGPVKPSTPSVDDRTVHAKPARAPIDVNQIDGTPAQVVAERPARAPVGQERNLRQAQSLVPLVKPARIDGETRALDWRVGLFVLWMIGAFLVSLRYAIGWFALRRIQRRAVPVSDVRLRLLVKRTAAGMRVRRRIRLVWGAEGSMPLTFGCFQPTVLLPEEARDWVPERLMVVLKHELAHVKRWDCLVQAMVYVACTIYWFNPIVWIAAAQSHREREMACDDYVLSSGSQGSEYAGHLLEIARSLHGPRLSGVTTIAMARRSELEGRLLAILSPNRSRERTTAQNALTTFAILGCLVMTVAAVRPVAMTTSDRQEVPGRETSVSVAIPAQGSPVELEAEASYEGSHARIEGTVRTDDQYVAEASAIVEQAAATLEASLSRLVPQTVRLNGAVAAMIDGTVSFGAGADLEIVRTDTIPLEQILRLRSAGVDVDYIEEMAGVGFDRLTVEQLISLAHADVDAEYVRNMRAAGFDDLDPHDLIELGFAGVDVEDIRVWADMGFTDLSTHDLIRLAHADVDAAFIEQMRDAGYSSLSAEDLVRLSHADVDAAFIGELAEMGLSDLGVSALIKLGHADVDAAFIREMRESGYDDLSVDELIQVGYAGVDAAYISELARAGVTGLSAMELVQLSHADVDADVIADLSQSGLSGLSATELMQLGFADVDGEYIAELASVGLTGLSASDLVMLGHAGVDADDVRMMREMGIETTDPEKIVQFKHMGLDPEYVERIRRALDR